MNAITRDKISKLKAAGEDNEWYPTTTNIIREVSDHFHKFVNKYHHCKSASLLDIGAGDGRVLEGFRDQLHSDDWYKSLPIKMFAIEKSQVHLSSMPKDVSVIGTDFHQQTLVDKRVSAIFCNPPYSEFEAWASRIIRESAAELVYLVIPRRWRDSELIKLALESRDTKVVTLGEFDFENADRRARAKVDVLAIEIRLNKNESFNKAIEDMLPELSMFDDQTLEESEQSKPNQMVEGGGMIETLVRCYDADLKSLYDNYRSIVKVNVRLLKELGVTKTSILNGLRQKISGLKDQYWQNLFSHLGDVTKKLATKQRKQFLESLVGKGSIDFTEGNILSMLIWISKWASDYYDEQLVELYKTLAQIANVQNYKSNQKVLEKGNWRYLAEGQSHYKLEYRLVLETHGGINTTGYDHNGCNGLCNRSHELLSDFITVANNLGFACSDKSENYKWVSKKKNEIMLDDGEVLMAVRAFKNGNLHIHVNKQVMLAINIQAGKLLGWLRSADEAATELGASDTEFVDSMFARSNRIAPKNILRVTHEAVEGAA